MSTSGWNKDTYFNYLQVPETWRTLEEFADWYMANKMPLRIPEDSHVYGTEFVTSYIMFRQDVYQVEMYVVKPNISTGLHSHPGVELFMCQIGSMHPGITWGKYTPTLHSGEYHDADFHSMNGAIFLTFQKWEDKSKMTSVSVHWKGKTDGPVHEALIRLHRPRAHIRPGYADSTRED